MNKRSKFRSDAFESIHHSATALFEVGAIDEKEMRRFDKSCLVTPPEIKPHDIQAIRVKNKVSQPVFARYLNTSPLTVQKWETGAKKPSGMALKLLSLVQKHGLQVLN